MKIKSIIIYITAFVFLSNCKEEFLERSPLGVVSDESFFLTEVGPLEALYGAYNQLQYDDIQGRGIWFFGSCASDDAETGGKLDGYEDEDGQWINEMRHNSTNVRLLNNWAAWYIGIQRTNTIITNLPKSKYLITEEEKDLILAEAKFLRAFYYFQLAKVYGGVPVSGTPIQPDEAKTINRSTLAETYAFIEKDLLEAVDVLPDFNVNKARVTKGTANALLAQLYLFESSYAKNYSDDPRFEGFTQKWDKVVQHAEAVINSPAGYKLVGMNGKTYKSNYSNETNGLMFLFTIEGNNSEEAIFEIQNYLPGSVDEAFTGDPNQGYSTPNGEWLRGQGSSYAKYNIPRDLEGSADKGWGFNNPTSDFMDEMAAYFPNDPRIDRWIAKEGDTTLNLTNPNKWYKIKLASSHTGYFHRKTDYCHPSLVGSGWFQIPMNVRLIRLADVILFAAEAEFELGNEPKAREYVNLIRKRTRDCGLAKNAGAPADLKGPITLQDIIRERRIELCFEGQRFFDLVRWRIADEEISGCNSYYIGTIDFEPGKHEFFPIPQFEIDKSGGHLKQNPGY